MTDSYVNNYIAYAFSIVDFMLFYAAVYKGHQIVIMRVNFQF